VHAAQRQRLEAFVRDRLTPAVTDLGWTPRPGDDELTRQLRGDLIRAAGTLGDDKGVQARAAELYRNADRLDPNVLPAVINVLAHAGDAARYDEFLQRFRGAATPQEEQRYLYALAAFRPPSLIEQTLTHTINGEIRTQDAPFVNRAMLMSVHARELAWKFITANWDTMDGLYPKHGLRRMAEGVIGLASPELEREVHDFFAQRKIEFGGKTLEQYLEQLRVAVALRGREGVALTAYLARF
jgi:puromycin-sensitive aminopeptidase